VYGGGFGISPSYQREKCVVEKTARGHGRKPARFCRGKQVFIFEKNRETKRNIGLFPWGTPPAKPLPPFEHGIRRGPPVIQENFAILQPKPPILRGRMAVSPGEVGQNG